uniref:RNA ligase domain-containing protein n=1 Tax=Marseillevirus LCMAC103 TaxID=2506604 RepID=A0A481YV94_9VIRU|nr:MAG: hypothetical protein LCMAC103_03630 [Marseillevirus LCMAC103]
MQVRTFPSIKAGSCSADFKNIDLAQRIVVQEKVDGSQLTVFKKAGALHYYNKTKEINPQGSLWRNVWLSLHGKEKWFQEGLYYHGEAVRNRLPNVTEYARTPRHCWIVYEIARQDGTVLTPEEMAGVLAGPGLETVALIYDSKRDGAPGDLLALVNRAMDRIDAGGLRSCLGGTPEGIVLKALNVPRQGATTTTRLKFVRREFQEVNHQKKKRLPEVGTAEFIRKLGEVFDTDARRHKAIQHLREGGRWKVAVNQNIGAMVAELDRDLLKEAADEIKAQLFIRFWPEISKAARGDVARFLAE